MAKEEKKLRYKSLDILRGLTIALMVLVNTPGDWGVRYGQLKHSDWNGFTITDWVFPAFLFIMGVAMSFSFGKKNIGYRAFFNKVTSRSLKIYGIGLLLSLWAILLTNGVNFSFSDLNEVSYTGVLQRIAITYLLASFLLRFINGIKGTVVMSFLILLLYWGILWLFGETSYEYTLEGNAILKLDMWLYNLEIKGNWVPFDTEGTLSNLSASINVIFGYTTGLIIQKSRKITFTFILVLIAGISFIVLSIIWDLWFPINKPLWTSSYVVYSTGWVLLILALLIWFVEILKIEKWSYPLEAMGKNPLFIYIVSDALQELLYCIPFKESSLQEKIYAWFFNSWLTDLNASLLFAVIYVLLMFLLAIWLDKKKIYMKV